MNSQQPACGPDAAEGLQRKTEDILDALDACYGVGERPDRDPVEVLVRGVLSQNTSDSNSGRAFAALRQRYGSWDAVRRAPLDELAQVIRRGGLARQKAASIHEALSWLHGRGEYDMDFLESLPIEEAQKQLTAIKGIGVKTARLVLLFGFGRPAFVVDTHVLRVSRRLGLIKPSCSRLHAHEILSALIPARRTYSAHMNMIRLGRSLCRPRKPDCRACPAARYCLHWQSC